MRFLPVFLDLQSGVVLLVGAGDLARAKLRLLAAAGARVRWFATDGNHDLSGLDAEDAARIERAEGDPLAADLVRRHRDPLRGRRRHRRCDVGAREGGRPARQCDGRPRAFDFHLSRHRRSRRCRRRRRHRRHLAGGGAPRARAHRGGAAGAHRRSRRLHRRLPQVDACAHSRICAAPPLLGARDRRPDRRAGARRPQGRGRSGAASRSPIRPHSPARTSRARPRAG